MVSLRDSIETKYMEEEDDKFGSQEAMNVAFDYMEHNE